MLPHHKWSFLRPHTAAADISAESSASALPCDRLFAASREAVLIVDAAADKIMHANPSAADLLGTTRQALVGSQFQSAFDRSSRAQMRQGIRTALDSGSSEALDVRAQGGGIDLKALMSLVRASPDSYLLVRLEAPAANARGVHARGDSPVFESIDAAPVGFLITGSGLHIDYANRAFIDMAGVESEAELRASPLTRWLRFSSADLARLSHQLSQREATSRLTTQLCSVRNPSRRVEVCAVPVPDGDHTWWGFTVSDLPRLN